MTLENRKWIQWEHKYHECLALEFSNPKYFEVHHILVLAYMLQTDGYSNEYFPVATNLLKKFLTSSITPQKFINDFKTINKNQNIQINTKNRNIDKFKWDIDIMDVKTNNAEEYCEDIKLWAKDVLQVIESKRIYKD